MPRPPRQPEFEVMAPGRLRRTRSGPPEEKATNSVSTGKIEGRPQQVSFAPMKEEGHVSAQ